MRFSARRIVTSFFVVFLIATNVFGQEPFSQKTNPTDTLTQAQKDSVAAYSLLVDTMPIRFYFQGRETVVFDFADTTLTETFHQYDPLRRLVFEGLNLGNTGSPSRLLKVDGFRPVGVDWGFHAFDAYYNDVEDLPFYSLGRALTDTYFSFKGQGNAVFRAKFSRQFHDGFQFSLKYDNINQLGQFLSQTDKISSLATGLQYLHPKKRYRAYLTLSSSKSQVRDNGGLATDTLFFKKGFERPETQPIRLIAAQTLHLKKHFQLLHFYKLGQLSQGNFLELGQRIWVGNQTYKFFDNAKKLDTLFYGPLLTDARGVRQFFSGKEMGTELSLGFKGHRSDSTVFEWLPTAGISMAQYTTNQEPLKFTQTLISLTGKWDIIFKKIFQLSASGRLGLVGHTGDYRLAGRLGINSGKIGLWSLSADFQSVTPSLLAQNNYISQIETWSKTFDKEFINRVGGQYSLPQYKLTLGTQLSLLTNHIYFGKDGIPKQSAASIPVFQLFFRKDIRFNHFYWSNDLLFQKVGENIIRRPAFYAHEQLYWKGDVFNKALRLKVGLDYRFFSSYQPDAYQPAIGQFVLQDSLTTENINGVDLFAIFKVSTFRFFVKMENVNYYWDKHIFYETAWQPQFRPTLRMGIAWRFRD